MTASRISSPPSSTDPRKAVMALKWAVRERWRTATATCRSSACANIEGYNARLEGRRAIAGEVLMRRIQTGFNPETGQPIFEEQALDLNPLPFIIVVVDEMGRPHAGRRQGHRGRGAAPGADGQSRRHPHHQLATQAPPRSTSITGTNQGQFPDPHLLPGDLEDRQPPPSSAEGRRRAAASAAATCSTWAGGGRITRVHGPFVGDKEGRIDRRLLEKAGASPPIWTRVTEDEEAPLLPEDGGERRRVGATSSTTRAVALVCRERQGPRPASCSATCRLATTGRRASSSAWRPKGVVSSANHVGKREVLARHVE